MEEIKIYIDKEKENEVQGSVEFEEVVAGEIATRQIYVYNNTEYYLNVELNLEGESISISRTIEQIAPKQTEEVEFKFTPKITIMKPITARLKIKISYVVR
ncbi:MAG: hypothetical protein QQN41_00135 [Nitrosopumilus sp.]